MVAKGMGNIDCEVKMAVTPKLDVKYSYMKNSVQSMSAGIYNIVEGQIDYRSSDEICQNHARGLLYGQTQIAADYFYKHQVLKESSRVKLLDGCLFNQ